MAMSPQAEKIYDRVMKLGDALIEAERREALADLVYELRSRVEALEKQATAARCHLEQPELVKGKLIALADRIRAEIGQAVGKRDKRIDYAFDLIGHANSVTLMSLDEMAALVKRALNGEFDADLR